jgi:hypothetical protein
MSVERARRTLIERLGAGPAALDSAAQVDQAERPEGQHRDDEQQDDDALEPAALMEPPQRLGHPHVSDCIGR